MPTPVYAQAVIAGDNPSVTVTQVPSDYTWNITLVTTPATGGSGTFIVMSGVRIIGSGTLGATIGPFTAYGDEQIKLQVTGTGIAGSTVAITGLAYSRGETVPPVSPIPASATNIISGSVDITTGTVSLSPGAALSQIPSTNIPATNTAGITDTSAGGTFQLLNNSTGSQQYILIALQGVFYPSGNTTTASCTINATGTSSQSLGTVAGGYSATASQDLPFTTDLDLHDLLLPAGAGVQYTKNGNGRLYLTLFYAIFDGTNPISSLAVKSS